MIVWLASYPRSGNTLLREILWQTMGLSSYSDDPVHPNATASFKQAAGHIEYAGEWESFYAQAAASPKAHFIKTHRTPRDEARAIYVVRDGRSSCESYYHFQNTYFPGSCTSYAEVIVGDVTYGDWSAHFAGWDRRPNTLVVRFEELVSAGPALLARIAGFIGYEGEVRPWKNPIMELHQRDPAFFRRGETTWKASDQWTAAINALFWAFHGPLMERLGYAQSSTAVAPEQLGLARELAGLFRAGVARRGVLQEACDERLAALERLDSSFKHADTRATTLQKACDERMLVIQQLEANLKATEAQGKVLQQACDQRLMLIERLHK